MWVFTTEGQTDAPDLVINGDEITFSWDSGADKPDEDEDINIDVVVHNLGTQPANNWIVRLYDGKPTDKKITEFSCIEDPDCSIPSGEVSHSSEYGMEYRPLLDTMKFTLLLMTETTMKQEQIITKIMLYLKSKKYQMISQLSLHL